MDRDEIRARVEKATPGPWENAPMGEDSTIHKIKVRYCIDHGPEKLWHNLICLENTGYAQHCSWAQRAKDAEFIAHAREDIPALLDALEAAEAENRVLRTTLHEMATMLEAHRMGFPAPSEEYYALRDHARVLFTERAPGPRHQGEDRANE